MRAIVERDLKDARVPGLSTDRYLPQPIMLSSNLPKWPLHVPGIRSLEQLCIKRTLLSKGDEVGLGYPGGAHLGHVHRMATS